MRNIIVIAVTAVLTVGYAASGGILRVGLLPVVDETGERFGEGLSENLTRMIFFDAGKLGMQPVFLNPGRNFEPSDTETALELARQASVDAVMLVKLIAITDKARWAAFHKNLGDSRAKERLTSDVSTLGKASLYNLDVENLLSNKRALLICESSIWAAKDPAKTQTFYGSAEIKLSFLQELAASQGLSDLGYSKFKDTPVGHAAEKSAQLISSAALETAPALGIMPTGKAIAAEKSCEITFRISYSSKKRASKNYTVAINGKEESMGIQDGVVKVKVTSGLLHVRVTLQDAPYRLPVQKNYDANVYFDCGQAATNLVLEIGAAGEGYLIWKDP